ncbi:hypothetical protein Bca52824_016361 [Brassica carinata]|uniref:Uncharacterized protein n=1 Tax=Brassica carinata TaxID=52824 RepID=A0A8X7W3G1_BRACI|nr:hypothetical protein Bca52824_016361 [Brassica carinata]
MGVRSKEGRGQQGKGKGKMYEEDDAKWIRVEAREYRRENSDRSRFRGDEVDSRYRRPRHELPRNSTQDGPYWSSGFRGEVSLLKEGQVILAPVKELGTIQVSVGNEIIENGLDVVNEDMLAQENLITDDMETDEKNVTREEVTVTNDAEDEFQDLTDEESAEIQVPLQGDTYAGFEKGEEGGECG